MVATLYQKAKTLFTENFLKWLLEIPKRMTKAKLDNKKGDADFNNVEDISGIEDSNTVVSVPKNDDLDRSLKLAQLKTAELTNKKLEV